jgi:hypothetical protein
MAERYLQSEHYQKLAKFIKGVPKRGIVKPAHPYIEKSRPPKKPKAKT